MTWHLDRLARSATVCLVFAWLLPTVMAFLVEWQSDVDSVRGGMLVGALVVAIGAVVGSMVTAGAGVALFGVVAALAQPGVWWLAGSGVALIAALMLVDLSITARRAPMIDRRVWFDAVGSFAAIAGLATIGTATAFGVGGLSTWQAMLLPVGIVAIGYAARLAADAHHRQTQPNP